MTTKPITIKEMEGKRTQFPDFPPRQDMQNWLHLYRRSFPVALSNHLGNPEHTIAANEVPLSPSLETWNDIRIPDLMVSVNANPNLLIEQRGYAIDAQGKPPDFVLEVASPSTGTRDYTDKREDYERYGVLEYWRFDESGGAYHDAALAGDRLIGGKYVPIEIECVDEETCQGYSESLRLYLCWEQGELRWYDPFEEKYLQTYEEITARADRAESRAANESSRADRAESRAANESARADRAEAELRRLREQLNRPESAE